METKMEADSKNSVPAKNNDQAVAENSQFKVVVANTGQVVFDEPDNIEDAIASALSEIAAVEEIMGPVKKVEPQRAAPEGGSLSESLKSPVDGFDILNWNEDDQSFEDDAKTGRVIVETLEPAPLDVSSLSICDEDNMFTQSSDSESEKTHFPSPVKTGGYVISHGQETSLRPNKEHSIVQVVKTKEKESIKDIKPTLSLSEENILKKQKVLDNKAILIKFAKKNRIRLKRLLPRVKVRRLSRSDVRKIKQRLKQRKKQSKLQEVIQDSTEDIKKIYKVNISSNTGVIPKREQVKPLTGNIAVQSKMENKSSINTYPQTIIKLEKKNSDKRKQDNDAENDKTIKIIKLSEHQSLASLQSVLKVKGANSEHNKIQSASIKKAKVHSKEICKITKTNLPITESTKTPKTKDHKEKLKQLSNTSEMACKSENLASKIIPKTPEGSLSKSLVSSKASENSKSLAASKTSSSSNSATVKKPSVTDSMTAFELALSQPGKDAPKSNKPKRKSSETDAKKISSQRKSQQELSNKSEKHKSQQELSNKSEKHKTDSNEAVPVDIDITPGFKIPKKKAKPSNPDLLGSILNASILSFGGKDTKSKEKAKIKEKEKEITKKKERTTSERQSEKQDSDKEKDIDVFSHDPLGLQFADDDILPSTEKSTAAHKSSETRKTVEEFYDFGTSFFKSESSQQTKPVQAVQPLMAIPVSRGPVLSQHHIPACATKQVEQSALPKLLQPQALNIHKMPPYQSKVLATSPVGIPIYGTPGTPLPGTSPIGKPVVHGMQTHQGSSVEIDGTIPFSKSSPTITQSNMPHQQLHPMQHHPRLHTQPGSLPTQLLQSDQQPMTASVGECQPLIVTQQQAPVIQSARQTVLSPPALQNTQNSAGNIHQQQPSLHHQQQPASAGQQQLQLQSSVGHQQQSHDATPVQHQQSIMPSVQQQQQLGTAGPQLLQSTAIQQQLEEAVSQLGQLGQLAVQQKQLQAVFHAALNQVKQLLPTVDVQKVTEQLLAGSVDKKSEDPCPLPPSPGPPPPPPRVPYPGEETKTLGYQTEPVDKTDTSPRRNFFQHQQSTPVIEHIRSLADEFSINTTASFIKKSNLPRQATEHSQSEPIIKTPLLPPPRPPGLLGDKPLNTNVSDDHSEYNDSPYDRSNRQKTVGLLGDCPEGKQPRLLGDQPIDKPVRQSLLGEHPESRHHDERGEGGYHSNIAQDHLGNQSSDVGQGLFGGRPRDMTPIPLLDDPSVPRGSGLLDESNSIIGDGNYGMSEEEDFQERSECGDSGLHKKYEDDTAQGGFSQAKAEWELLDFCDKRLLNRAMEVYEDIVNHGVLAHNIMVRLILLSFTKRDHIVAISLLRRVKETNMLTSELCNTIVMQCERCEFFLQEFWLLVEMLSAEDKLDLLNNDSLSKLLIAYTVKGDNRIYSLLHRVFDREDYIVPSNVLQYVIRNPMDNELEMITDLLESADSDVLKQLEPQMFRGLVEKLEVGGYSTEVHIVTSIMDACHSNVSTLTQHKETHSQDVQNSSDGISRSLEPAKPYTAINDSIADSQTDKEIDEATTEMRKSLSRFRIPFNEQKVFDVHISDKEEGSEDEEGEIDTKAYYLTHLEEVGKKGQWNELGHLYISIVNETPTIDDWIIQKLVQALMARPNPKAISTGFNEMLRIISNKRTPEFRGHLLNKTDYNNITSIGIYLLLSCYNKAYWEAGYMVIKILQNYGIHYFRKGNAFRRVSSARVALIATHTCMELTNYQAALKVLNGCKWAMPEYEHPDEREDRKIRLTVLNQLITDLLAEKMWDEALVVQANLLSSSEYDRSIISDYSTYIDMTGVCQRIIQAALASGDSKFALGVYKKFISQQSERPLNEYTYRALVNHFHELSTTTAKEIFKKAMEHGVYRQNSIHLKPRYITVLSGQSVAEITMVIKSHLEVLYKHLKLFIATGEVIDRHDLDMNIEIKFRKNIHCNLLKHIPDSRNAGVQKVIDALTKHLGHALHGRVDRKTKQICISPESLVMYIRHIEREEDKEMKKKETKPSSLIKVSTVLFKLLKSIEEEDKTVAFDEGVLEPSMSSSGPLMAPPVVPSSGSLMPPLMAPPSRPLMTPPVAPPSGPLMAPPVVPPIGSSRPPPYLHPVSQPEYAHEDHYSSYNNERPYDYTYGDNHYRGPQDHDRWQREALHVDLPHMRIEPHLKPPILEPPMKPTINPLMPEPVFLPPQEPVYSNPPIGHHRPTHPEYHLPAPHFAPPHMPPQLPVQEPIYSHSAPVHHINPEPVYRPTPGMVQAQLNTGAMPWQGGAHLTNPSETSTEIPGTIALTSSNKKVKSYPLMSNTLKFKRVSEIVRERLQWHIDSGKINVANFNADVFINTLSREFLEQDPFEQPPGSRQDNVKLRRLHDIVDGRVHIANIKQKVTHPEASNLR